MIFRHFQTEHLFGSAKITGIFGENVFTLKTAREFLSDEAYKSLVASIKGRSKRLTGHGQPDRQQVSVHGQKAKVLPILHTGFNH